MPKRATPASPAPAPVPPASPEALTASLSLASSWQEVHLLYQKHRTYWSASQLVLAWTRLPRIAPPQERASATLHRFIDVLACATQVGAALHAWHDGVDVQAVQAGMIALPRLAGTRLTCRGSHTRMQSRSAVHPDPDPGVHACMQEHVPALGAEALPHVLWSLAKLKTQTQGGAPAAAASSPPALSGMTMSFVKALVGETGLCLARYDMQQLRR